MATTRKNYNNFKEKRGVSLPATLNLKAPHGRSSISSPAASSPDKNTRARANIPLKPAPNYLRPTISSCNEICKYGMPQQPRESLVAGHLTRRRSMDKPPSSPRPISNGLKERTSKPTASAPLLRTVSSPKSNSYKAAAPKSHRPAMTPPLLAKRRSPGNVKKKEAGMLAPTNLASGKQGVIEALETKSEPGIFVPVAKVTLEEAEKVDDINFENGTINIPQLQDPSLEVHETPNLSQELKIVKDERDEKNVNGEESLLDQGESNGEALGKPTVPRARASLDDSDDETAPRKLKFRKGIEVDIEDEGSATAPERLKFKEREVNTNEDVVAVEGVRENAVFKRQGVQPGKKEAAPAYNDVIEETASKLVAEKRKSKVKALVGAFETVISFETPQGQQQAITTGASETAQPTVVAVDSKDEEVVTVVEEDSGAKKAAESAVFTDVSTESTESI